MIRRLLVLFLLGTFTQLGAQAALAQTREDCLQCHNDKTLTKEGANKKTISLFVEEKILNASEHAKVNCVSCHVGFNAEELPHKAEITPVDCARCHTKATFKHQFHPQLLKAVSANRIGKPSCQACHGAHDVKSSKVAGNPFSKERLTQDCGQCHKKAAEHFPASAHGKALAQNVKGAPDCLTCHKSNVAFVTHAADSLAAKKAQNTLCLSCHLDNEDVKARTSPTAGFIKGYEQSVHGRALEGGAAGAANCVSCHGSHDMKRGSDGTSFVARLNIPMTCGACHTKIADEYNASVHGVEVARGNDDSPMCTSCHGEHAILGKDDPKSRVAPLNLSAQVCQPCHESVALSAKYGLQSDRFKTFTDSYHGLAGRGGDLAVANCASCHGGHDIKPSTDSTSTVHKSNLKVTCGKCHPGATERFAEGKVHLTMTQEDEPILFWVSLGYIILIVLIIGGMVVHNLLDFRMKSKRQLMLRRGLIEEEHGGHTLYLRMSLNERLQHATLVVSFIILVITGFALRFPEAWWVAPLHRNFPGAFDLRSLVHRIAGVVMLIASVYHIYYIAVVPRGRQLVKDLFPVPQDLRDVFGVLRYNLGWSSVKPKFGRFSYIEKSEYWALIWGNIVMGATGVILWFDNTFVNLLTKLGWDIARTVHYYEAWLATLSILVWHMYFVIFNPEIYPINLAFWKGTLTEKEMLDEHPLELEKLKAEAVEEEEDDEPGVKPA
ncbi:MAG: cytochrome b/b6 domain-containing protein [Gemmatimonadetes bacterium]|nr:cytochrome b/b6 domain-containing protein [Gemmatimonadota bacterium]